MMLILAHRDTRSLLNQSSSSIIYTLCLWLCWRHRKEWTQVSRQIREIALRWEAFSQSLSVSQLVSSLVLACACLKCSLWWPQMAITNHLLANTNTVLLGAQVDFRSFVQIQAQPEWERGFWPTSSFGKFNTISHIISPQKTVKSEGVCLLVALGNKQACERK